MRNLEKRIGLAVVVGATTIGGNFLVNVEPVRAGAPTSTSTATSTVTSTPTFTATETVTPTSTPDTRNTILADQYATSTALAKDEAIARVKAENEATRRRIDAILGTPTRPPETIPTPQPVVVFVPVTVTPNPNLITIPRESYNTILDEAVKKALTAQAATPTFEAIPSPLPSPSPSPTPSGGSGGGGGEFPMKEVAGGVVGAAVGAVVLTGIRRLVRGNWF